jgi:hypothetical protein
LAASTIFSHLASLSPLMLCSTFLVTMSRQLMVWKPASFACWIQLADSSLTSVLRACAIRASTGGQIKARVGTRDIYLLHVAGVHPDFAQPLQWYERRLLCTWGTPSAQYAYLCAN